MAAFKCSFPEAVVVETSQSVEGLFVNLEVKTFKLLVGLTAIKDVWFEFF